MRFTSILALGMASCSMAAPNLLEGSSMKGLPISTDEIPSLEKLPVDLAFSTDSLPVEALPVEHIRDICETVEQTVCDKVDTITDMTSGKTDEVDQLPLVDDIKDALTTIVEDVNDTVADVVNTVLPHVLEVVGDVLELVTAVLAVVLALVLEIVGSLLVVVEGLVASVKALLVDELAAIIVSLKALVLPILLFVKTVAGEIEDVVHNVTVITTVVNSACSALDLPLLDL